MKMKKYLLMIIAISALGFSGYKYLNNVANTSPSVVPKMKEVDNSPIVLKVSEYAKEDQDFLVLIKKSIRETEKMIAKLEDTMSDAEDNDEMMEATESMTDTKKQLLFYWNSIHNNGYTPKDEGLLKLKTRYEAILDNYREGISMELDGMEEVDSMKMKAGYEMTAIAKKDLQELLKIISV